MSGGSYDQTVSEAYLAVARSGVARYDHVYAVMTAPDNSPVGSAGLGRVALKISAATPATASAAATHFHRAMVRPADADFPRLESGLLMMNAAQGSGLILMFLNQHGLP